MNILKKYSMAIVAVMMVIGFSAFKVGENNIERTGYWHLYSPIGGDPENPDNYSEGEPIQPECMDGQEVCAVWTPDDELTEEYLKSLDLASGIGNNFVIFKD